MMTEWKPKETENSALDDYSNAIKWTEYLLPAPMIIALLGELSVLSNQYQDFSLSTNESREFEHIKFPESFKTTLMQICDESYYTFETAHNNMDKLRQQTARVPGLLSQTLQLLAQGEDEEILDYLPISVKGIKKIAQESKELSHETADKFDNTAKLIDEVTLASKSIEGLSTSEKKRITLAEEVAKNKKEELEKQKELEKEALDTAKRNSEKAAQNYQKALDNIPSGWDLLGMELGETLIGIVRDVAKLKIAQEFGQHEYDQSSTKSTLIAQSSNISLLEKLSTVLLSAIKSFSNDLFEKNKQSEVTVKCNALSNVETVKQFSFSLEEEVSENHDLDKDLEMKLHKAMSSLHSSLKNIQRHCREKKKKNNADELSLELHKARNLLQKAINSMNNILRKSKIPPTQSKPTKEEHANSEIARESLKNAQEQVTSAREMLKDQQDREREERKEYIKAVNSFTEVQDKIITLNAKFHSIVDILELLKKALLVLSNLSAHWRKMADFFKMMDTMVVTWEEGPMTQFIEIINKGLENTEEHKVMTNIAKNMMFGYAKESASYAFVINRVSTGYFQISSKYLLIPMASLKTLMALDDKNEKQIKRKKLELKEQADKAVDKIKQFGKIESERTINSLKKKQEAIDKEFKNILSTQSPKEKRIIIKNTKKDLKKMKELGSIVQGNMEQYSKIQDDFYKI